MDIVQLKKDIKNKTLGKLYIFTGENIGLQNIYISKFPNPTRIQELETVKTKLTVKNLFSSEDTTYVVRDDKEFFNKKANIELLKDFKYNKVILLFTEVDKRATWYKEFKDHIVEFRQMTRKQLAKIVHEEIDIRDEKFVDELIERCNFDYSQVINTCNQLQLVSGRYTIQLLDSICPPPVDASVFTVFSYMMKRNINCMKELETVIAMGEPILKVLGALTKSLDDTVKCIKYDCKYCEEHFNMKAWLWKTRRNECKLSIEQLESIAIELNDAKQHIITGRLDDVNAIRIMMLKIIKIF